MDPDLLDADFVAHQGLTGIWDAAKDAGAPRAPSSNPSPSEAPSLDPLRMMREQVLSQLRQVRWPFSVTKI